MTLFEKFLHGILLGLAFSFLNWMFVNLLVLKISIFDYFLIELILVISIKIFIFTKRKLKLD